VIFRRLLLAVTAAAMFAAGAAVGVAALAFALYALVEPRLGRAGAAATVAMTTMVLMLTAGLSIGLATRKKRSKAPAPTPAGVFDKAMAFVRSKPVVAASAAVGAGLMATRNPRYLGDVLRAFLDGGSPRK
jgi:hypothetical protein